MTRGTISVYLHSTSLKIGMDSQTLRCSLIVYGTITHRTTSLATTLVTQTSTSLYFVTGLYRVTTRSSYFNSTLGGGAGAGHGAASQQPPPQRRSQPEANEAEGSRATRPRVATKRFSERFMDRTPRKEKLAATPPIPSQELGKWRY